MDLIQQRVLELDTRIAVGEKGRPIVITRAVHRAVFSQKGYYSGLHRLGNSPVSTLPRGEQTQASVSSLFAFFFVVRIIASSFPINQPCSPPYSCRTASSEEYILALKCSIWARAGTECRSPVQPWQSPPLSCSSGIDLLNWVEVRAK